MRVYFDTCCYGRPFDNKAHQSQFNVRWEIAAIMDAVRLCRVSEFVIIGSAAVVAEIGLIKNDVKRERVQWFYDETVNEEIAATDVVSRRALELTAHGLKDFDAYHVAFSESVGVDFLLTTDIRFERCAEKLDLKVKVINPINFLEEYIKWLRRSI